LQHFLSTSRRFGRPVTPIEPPRACGHPVGTAQPSADTLIHAEERTGSAGIAKIAIGLCHTGASSAAIIQQT